MRLCVQKSMVMHRDVVPMSGPDQQRISAIGHTLIAVAPALDDAQSMPARKGHGGDIGRATRNYRPDTGRRGPGAHPSESLRQRDIVGETIGILRQFALLRLGSINVCAPWCYPSEWFCR